MNLTPNVFYFIQEVNSNKIKEDKEDQNVNTNSIMKRMKMKFPSPFWHQWMLSSIWLSLGHHLIIFITTSYILLKMLIWCESTSILKLVGHELETEFLLLPFSKSVLFSQNSTVLLVMSLTIFDFAMSFFSTLFLFPSPTLMIHCTFSFTIVSIPKSVKYYI